MAAANLVVKLDSDPGIAKSEMAEEKMKQSDQEVLEDFFCHFFKSQKSEIRFRGVFFRDVRKLDLADDGGIL